MKTKKKRGPKEKPAEQHHTPRPYKHAPDVIAILDQLPAGTRARFVDDAIRYFHIMKKRVKTDSKPK